MKLKKIINVPLIGLLSGCAGKNLYPEHLRNPQPPVEHYIGETVDYYVEASETFHRGVCMTRKITIRSKNRLYQKRVVTHLVATDRYCNDSIENFRFNHRDEGQFNLFYLGQDVLSAFYEIKYGPRKKSR